MLIVVSVGTDHHRFDRLLGLAAAAADRLGADMVAQSGFTPPPAGSESVDFMPATELAELMGRADAVVCHGGPGTIALARSVGHRPIVVARDPELGEHVDDHQMRFAGKLAAEDVVDCASSLDDLIALLSNPRPRLQERTGQTNEDAVRQFAALVESLMAGTLAPRRWRDRFLLRRVDRPRTSSGPR